MNSRRSASAAIHAQVTSNKAVSTNAERCSNFPCPKGCDRSAGLSDRRTEKYVIAAATRSRPECAPSDIRPRLPVATPAANLSAVKNAAANTEARATRCFSMLWKCRASMVSREGIDPIIVPRGAFRSRLDGRGSEFLSVAWGCILNLKLLTYSGNCGSQRAIGNQVVLSISVTYYKHAVEKGSIARYLLACGSVFEPSLKNGRRGDGSGKASKLPPDEKENFTPAPAQHP